MDVVHTRIIQACLVFGVWFLVFSFWFFVFRFFFSFLVLSLSVFFFDFVIIVFRI